VATTPDGAAREHSQKKSAELADAKALLANLIERNRDDPDQWDVALVARLIVDKLREIRLLPPPADMPDGYPVEATWRKRAQELKAAIFARPVRDLLADVLRACGVENGRVSSLLASAERSEQLEKDRLYGEYGISDFQTRCCEFDPLPIPPEWFESKSRVAVSLLDDIYAKLWHPNEILQGRIKPTCRALEPGLFRQLISGARRIRADEGNDGLDGQRLRPRVWVGIKIRPELDEALELTANYDTRTGEDYAELVRTGKFERHLRGEVPTAEK